MSEGARVLLVDDDVPFTDAMQGWLRSHGHNTTTSASAEEARCLIESHEFAVVLLDILMPDTDGLELLKHIRNVKPDLQVIILTGSATVETAILSLKLGAYDYVSKPVEPERLLSILRAAVEHWQLAREAHRLESEVARLNTQLKERFGFHALVGKSASMQRIYDRVAAAARTRGTILIQGESGTGKELVARALHFSGTEGPFVPVNCAALPRDLIEAELFGHRRGSFTSAEAESAGLFVAANKGTLFLDEVTEMSPDTQAKLLRALQEKRIRPVGSTAEVPVDVRVIASTNRDPREAVTTGKLREDLFYRLSVSTIELPALRSRVEDIPLLVSHFLKKLTESHGARITGVDRSAMAALVRHSWPGNVRELENVIEQALTFGAGPLLTLADLPEHIGARSEQSDRPLKFEGVVSIAGAERLAIETALQKLEGNKTKAAQALGISRKHLYSRMRALGLKES